MMIKASSHLTLALALAASISVLQGCSTEPQDPLAEARLAFSQDNPRTALDLAIAATDAKPDDNEAKLLVAELSMVLGNPNRAIAELERVVAKEDAPQDANAKLIEAYVAGNFLTKARSASEKLNLDHPHAFVAATSLEMAEGEYEEAFRVLDQGLEQFPDHPRLATIDAERMLMLAQVEKAKQRLEGVLAKDANVAEAHVLSGRLYLAEGSLDEAQSHFETALRVRPAHQTSMLALAAIARDRGDEASAANWINKANSAGQPHPIGLLFAAQMAFDAGDVERAYVLIEKAPPSFSSQPQFARLSGFIDAARGEHGLAINPLQDYIEETGGDQMARRVLAESLAETGRFDEAWEVVGPMVGHPQTDGGTLVLALQLARETGLGDIAQIEALIRAKDQGPDLSTAMLEAGQAIKAGRWAEADAIFARYVDGAGASDPALLNNAAAVKSKLGQHGQAVALARRANEAAPGTAEILDTLGWALWLEGKNRDEARQLLTQAREKLPGNREIADHWVIAHSQD